MSNHIVSEHAKRRMRQRGIPSEIASVLLEHHDVSLHAGDACETVRLSAGACAGLLAQGVPPTVVERASRVAMVCSVRSGTVVTVLRPKRGRDGSRYRRQRPTRKRPPVLSIHAAWR